MRVVHLCRAFSPLSETFIYNQVTALDQYGTDTHVVTFERMRESERPFPNVHVVPPPSQWDMHRIWYRLMETLGRCHVAADWIILRLRLEDTFKRIKPDVVHAQFGQLGALVSPITVRLGIPLVVTFHGKDVSLPARDESWQTPYRNLFRSAALLIGVSNHICQKISALGAPAEKITLLHGGIRLDEFPYRNPFIRFDGRTVRCLHVGRLVEKKGPVLLVEAFHHAQKQLNGNPKLHLTIAGDGPLRDDVERRIKELNLQDAVDLLGAVPHPHVVSLLQTSHLYTQHCVTATNGDQEGQGITLVEASATGLPIVSTLHNGLPDVILHEKTGLLVEEGDYRAMGDAIAMLARNPGRWSTLGAAGRAHVEECFSLDRQTELAVSNYQRLIHAGNAVVQ